MDNGGISAQPTDGDGGSWTMCPCLRISPWYRWRGAVPACKCHISLDSISRTYLRVRRLIGQRGSHSRQELRLLPRPSDPHALELAVEPDIDIKVTGILMEVQERPGAAGEAAGPALSELRKPAQLDQQTRQTIKIILYCVPHTLSMVSGALACKPDPRVGMRTRVGTGPHPATLCWRRWAGHLLGLKAEGPALPGRFPSVPELAPNRHQ